MFSTLRILVVSSVLSLTLLAFGCEQHPATSAAPASTAPTTQVANGVENAEVEKAANVAPAATEEAAAPVDLTGTTPLKFSIHTIHCDGCVQAIRVALNGIEGVRACDVSLEKQSAVVHVTDPIVAKEIVEAMNRQGREATLQETAGDDVDPA